MLLYYRCYGRNLSNRKALELAKKCSINVLSDRLMTKEDIKKLMIKSSELKQIVGRKHINHVQDMTTNELIDFLHEDVDRIRMPQLICNGKLITGYNEEVYSKIFKK